MSTSTLPLPSTAATVQDAAALIDVKAVAAILDCSVRHVYRLADGGRMPAPVKLGALVRWRAEEIRTWIEDGCRPTRAPRKG
jgi:excisionase family DNA binding protein